MTNEIRYIPGSFTKRHAEEWLGRTLTQKQWQALIEALEDFDVALQVSSLVEQQVLALVSETDILSDD